MKTRIVFSPEDFDGSGQMIIRESSTPDSSDLLFAISVAYKVGHTTIRDGKKILNVVLFVALSDGMAAVFDNKKALCRYLNNDECGFRPMTCSEIAKVLSHQGNRFPKNGALL